VSTEVAENIGGQRHGNFPVAPLVLDREFFAERLGLGDHAIRRARSFGLKHFQGGIAFGLKLEVVVTAVGIVAMSVEQMAKRSILGDAPRCRGHSRLEASGLRAAGRLFSSGSGSGAPLL